MKYSFRLPILAGGIALAAALAFLMPTTGSHVQAQITVQLQGGRYYQPSGQGVYGRRGRGYSASAGSSYSLFPSRGGMFGRRTYGYSRSRNVRSRYGNTFDYGIAPPVRAYGRSSYYRPNYGGPVYAPFGYSGY